MRKLTTLLVLAALSSAVFAQTGKELVGGYVKTLTAAKTLSSSYTVQRIGDVVHEYSVQLSKPNLARIDTPWQSIVADGSLITTYDKNSKTYFKTPETNDGLVALFKENELNIWKGFFDSTAMMQLPDASIVGQKNRKGMQLTEVKANMDMAGRWVETFFFDKSNLPRQAEIVLTDKNSTTILDTADLTIGMTAAGPEMFAFKAPNGAKELSQDELNANKWYENLPDALAAAKASHRMILLEFSATWCGPCKMLAQEVFSTDKFKAESKYFVFCHIDVDEQPDLAKQYQANAIPQINFLTSDGKMVHQTIGYGGADQFFGEMDQAKAAGGL